MKPRTLRAIVVLVVVGQVLGVAVAPQAARPRGHPPPAVTLTEEAPTLDEVLESYVEATGGADAISRIDSRVVQARVVTDLPTWDPPVHEVDTLTVYSEASGRYLIVHSTPRGTVLEGCDGTTTWKRDVDGKVIDVGVMGGRDAWLVDPQFAERLREHFPDMEYLGKAMLAGRPVHVVDIDDDHSHRLYFDAETGLLSRLGYNRTIFRYAEVDGVKVPFEVEHSRKGGSSTFVLDSVIHNVPLDERLFSPPVGY
jgi:hypothetical protein